MINRRCGSRHHHSSAFITGVVNRICRETVFLSVPCPAVFPCIGLVQHSFIWGFFVLLLIFLFMPAVLYAVPSLITGNRNVKNPQCKAGDIGYNGLHEQIPVATTFIIQLIRCFCDYSSSQFGQSPPFLMAATWGSHPALSYSPVLLYSEYGWSDIMSRDGNNLNKRVYIIRHEPHQKTRLISSASPVTPT